MTAAAVAALPVACSGDKSEKGPTPAPRRPNILLYFPDQEAVTRIPALNRPNMQRVFGSTVSFKNAYASHPICCPSRATLFTGLYPHQAGMTYNIGLNSQFGPPLDVSLPNLATVFSVAGYDVGHFGKWHLSKAEDVENYGFKPADFWIAPGQGSGFREDAHTAEHAADWIRARSPDRPWLAVVSIINPHDILHPADYTDIPPRDVQLPDNFWDDARAADKVPEVSQYAAGLRATGHVPSDEAGWLQYLRTYFYLIERTDAQLGMVLDALDATGTAEDTVLIYSSDHGEMAGSHQLVQKLCMYEESVRIPFHIRYPRLFSGDTQSDLLVSNADILPTILDLTGVTWPTALPGQSLKDVSTKDPSEYRDEVLIESCFPLARDPDYFPTFALRTKNWKYVHYKSGSEELYDEDTDPGETANLAANPDYEATRQEMRDRLNQRLQETGAGPV